MFHLIPDARYDLIGFLSQFMYLVGGPLMVFLQLFLELISVDEIVVVNLDHGNGGIGDGGVARFFSFFFPLNDPGSSFFQIVFGSQGREFFLILLHAIVCAGFGWHFSPDDRHVHHLDEVGDIQPGLF